MLGVNHFVYDGNVISAKTGLITSFSTTHNIQQYTVIVYDSKRKTFQFLLFHIKTLLKKP